MRTALIGAVDSTRVALEALIRHGTPPLTVGTLPLSLAHRHSDFVDLRPLAESCGAPILEIARSSDPEVIRQLHELQLDYLIVIGWSQICGPEMMAAGRRGTIGYHPAPLPKNRGRAPLPWTILQRAKYTASTLFWLDEGVDSGDIIIQRGFDVAEDETATTLYDKHQHHLERMLDAILPQLAAGTAPRTPQDHTQATWCARRTPDDGWIDWRDSADNIWTLIRAVAAPYPGAFTIYEGRRLVVWEADFAGPGPYWGQPGQVQAVRDAGVLVQCGDRLHVNLRSVQLEGEPITPACQVLRLHRKLGIDPWQLYRDRITPPK